MEAAPASQGERLIAGIDFSPSPQTGSIVVRADLCGEESGVVHFELPPLVVPADPDAFVSLERRLATQNLADPDPPRVLHSLLATHPSTTKRIGYALAWRAGAENGAG